MFIRFADAFWGPMLLPYGRAAQLLASISSLLSMTICPSSRTPTDPKSCRQTPHEHAVPPVDGNQRCIATVARETIAAHKVLNCFCPSATRGSQAAVAVESIRHTAEHPKRTTGAWVRIVIESYVSQGVGITSTILGSLSGSLVHTLAWPVEGVFSGIGGRF